MQHKLIKCNDPRPVLAHEEIVEWKQQWDGRGWSSTTLLSSAFHLSCLVLLLSACHSLHGRDHLQLHASCGAWHCTLGLGAGEVLNHAPATWKHRDNKGAKRRGVSSWFSGFFLISCNSHLCNVMAEIIWHVECARTDGFLGERCKGERKHIRREM